MRDYERLIKNLRCCDFNGNCIYCDYMNDIEKCEAIETEAADAVEELVAERDQFRGQAKMVPQWVSVEEPPDNGRNIFICHGSADFKAPCIGHYEPNMKLFYEDKNWFASPIYDAMYWCEMPELPLPEPPKEVE